MADDKRSGRSSAAGQRALVIGVSNYPDPDARLPAVAADVREMAKVLASKHGAFGAKDVVVLADKQATRDKVLAALRAAFGGAADETVFVYLAGHGAEVGGRYYYVAHDTAGEATAVPLADIKALFDKTKSRRSFLWLDFCHSGGILARGRKTDDLAAIRRAIGVVGGHGKVIVAACTPAQSAYEDSTLGHGLFTHALLQGLKGAAKSAHGDVTAASLYEFIARQVKRHDQQPVFFGEMTGLIVLAHYPDRAAASAKATKPPPGRPAKPKKAAHKAGGMWAMLGERFFRADSLRHRSDNSLEVTATTDGGETAAAFAGLRSAAAGGSASLPFAAGDEAHLVRVRSVESHASGGRQVWTLILGAEDFRSGTGMEVTYNLGGRSYQPEDMARLRAGRILLNDPPPRPEPGLQSRGHAAEPRRWVRPLPGAGVRGAGRLQGPRRECRVADVRPPQGSVPAQS